MQRALIAQMSGQTPEVESKPKLESVPEPEAPSEPEEPFSFDAGFQSKIASLCLTDTDFLRRVDGLVKPDHFENQYEATLVAIALDHFEKYRSVPQTPAVWLQILKDALASNRIRRDSGKETLQKFKELRKGDISDAPFIVDKISEFARNQAVQRAMLKSLDLMEKGKMNDAQHILEKAFATGANDAFQDVDYWNDIERRTEYRRQKLAGLIKSTGVPTGIKDIDNLLYHKGWGRRELSVIMGGAKKGKSMGLGEFAARASINGYNALYVTLEVSSEIIMDRLDANISSTDMGELETKLNHVDTVITGRRGQNKGVLKVCQYPSGSLKPSDLRRILERYRSEGIKFDLIVVDYADIMAPDHYVDDARENSRMIWLALRAIGFQEDAAILTATQTNREGFKSSTAKAEHAAEDFNKVRIADLIISINRDEVETANGEARLFFAASRNQAGEFTLHIKQDLAKMKFIKKVVKTS